MGLTRVCLGVGIKHIIPEKFAFRTLPKSVRRAIPKDENGNATNETFSSHHCLLFSFLRASHLELINLAKRFGAISCE
jgi:hypothetical protein